MEEKELEKAAKEYFESLNIDHYLFGPTAVIKILSGFGAKLLAGTNVNPTGLPEWIVDLTEAPRSRIPVKVISDSEQTVSSAGKEVNNLTTQKEIDLKIAGQKLFGFIENIMNHSGDALSDSQIDWANKVMHETDEILSDNEEATFAKSPPASTEISDEEIEAYIEKSLPGWKSDGEWTGKAYSMRNIAKWVRKQLTGKP